MAVRKSAIRCTIHIELSRVVYEKNKIKIAYIDNYLLLLDNFYTYAT